MLVGNHFSLLEVIVLFSVTKLQNRAFPSFVSRVENLDVPLFGGIVRAVDAVLVNRDR